MSGSKTDPVLIIICGPTAVGKTKASIEIAEALNCPILSFDSRQFYRELKIGTAPPSQDELARVEHHFIGNLSIKDEYTAGMFEEDAIQKLDELFRNNRFCVAVGGSGLYINALAYGIDDIPSDEKIRQELELKLKEEGIEALQKEVEEIDPEFYAEADIQNPRRLMRAIEAHRLTAVPYSQQRSSQSKSRNFRAHWIGLDLDRESLFERINLRVDAMMKAGLEEEARSLLSHKHLKSLKTVGYRELFQSFDGDHGLEEAVRLIKRNSRRYAKQQIGWFKKNPEIHWFSPSEIDKMISHIHQNFMP